jgi:hypothetical protein
MNDVVCEAGEGGLAAIEEYFHFVGSGVRPNSFENVGGLVLT